MALAKGPALPFVVVDRHQQGAEPMDGSIRLSVSERKELLSAYRCGEDAKTARLAHIVLLAAEGWSQGELRAVTFASFDLIHECLRRFREGSVVAVLPRAQRESSMPRWLLKVAQWLTTRQPQDFGYFRSSVGQ